jgi:hypothetical protein
MTILPNETIRLSRRGNRFANDLPGAFSSEVETGSRQENASNQESSPVSILSKRKRL